jgi:HK97 family phage major capsid protein
MRKDDLRRLNEQRKTIHGEMRSMVEKATEEDRALSAEETQEYERMEGEFEELRSRYELGIKELKRDEQLERELGTSLELRIGEDDEVPTSLAEWRVKRLPNHRFWDTPEYRSAYFHYLSVRSPASDLDVEEHRTLSKATGAAGAYLVPTDMYDQIIRATRFMGSVAQLATEIRTATGDLLNVPANTAHGTASWTAENAGYTQSDETFAQVPLNAYKAATSIIISEELLTDSAFPLDGFLATEFGERIGVLENTGFISGSGTGQPQGLVGNVSNTQAASGNATTFSYSALVTAIFTLPYQYRRNAAFIAADSAVRNLYLMTDTQNRPLWSVNVATTGPDTFMGYPIYSDPDLATPAANAKSMIFGDIRRAYAVRRVDGFSMQRQNELYSNNGQVGFRGYERVDGRVVLSAAATTIQHSAT